MDAGPTYEFRWDVEVPGTERRFGQKFMKQWKRVLQAQKMAPLVSAKLSPREARFQLCVIDGADTPLADARAAEVAAELSHLRWPPSGSGGASPESHIRAEGVDRQPSGFQGVRVWVTYARQDVESVLGKKPRI